MQGGRDVGFATGHGRTKTPRMGKADHMTDFMQEKPGPARQRSWPRKFQTDPRLSGDGKVSGWRHARRFDTGMRPTLRAHVAAENRIRSLRIIGFQEFDSGSRLPGVECLTEKSISSVENAVFENRSAASMRSVSTGSAEKGVCRRRNRLFG